MKLNRLYIENFMCHSNSFIDFTQFNSALIVGRINNNDLYSNGVGKSTIFKAIEYVLFNQADMNLEKIIRDDTNNCKIVLDFTQDDQEYRVVRARTKKGSTDVSLYLKKDMTNLSDQHYHIDNNPVTNEVDWKDLSGRRAGDTEKELSKLLKINFKSFRSTVHFLQNDFTGLTTATPEKRKGILKESLSLVIYSKLEKIAKEQSAALSKDIDRHRILIDNLGDPSKDILDIESKTAILSEQIAEKNKELSKRNNDFNKNKSKLDRLILSFDGLKSLVVELTSKKTSTESEYNKLLSFVEKYKGKKSEVIKIAKQLSQEVKSIKETQAALAELDYSQIQILSEKLSGLKEQNACLNMEIRNNLNKIEELKVPLPKDSVCKHCRQPLSKEHKSICQNMIDEELKSLLEQNKEIKCRIEANNAIINADQQVINQLTTSKKQLDKSYNDAALKSQDIADKKAMHDEYAAFISKYSKDIELRQQEMEQIKNELNDPKFLEAENIKKQIELEKQNLNAIQSDANRISREMQALSNNQAVYNDNISQKKLDIGKKNDLIINLSSLQKKFDNYPMVIQAFSSTGIPNLIIQNMLDDLQIEANNLLTQLKPGLQLSFLVEKTKSDGSQDDTLDINYFVNGKARDYDQLSGAMKLAVTFSLKLGLSFILQKLTGADIKFLMLDEIDQSLDKASIDAFAEIVKFFEKEFTILVITHNDRMKDKFNHAILVEQDINMITTAKTVSSWN